MRILIAVVGLMVSFSAVGQAALLEIAAKVRDKRGLEKLVAASFGGGRHYQVKGSPFHVVDLNPTSGIRSTELFVFEAISGQLTLRVHVPLQSSIVMKAEVDNGMLIVSEKTEREGDWKVRLHLVSIVPTQ